MNDVEWAYAAGIIDGEGSVGMHMHNTGSHRVAVVTLTVTNGCRECLEFLSQRFGGEIIRVRSTNPNSRPSFHYKLVGRERLKLVLEGIQPYCIVKKGQIALALAFFEECPVQQGVPLSEEKTALRDSFIERFHILNKVGLV